MKRLICVALLLTSALRSQGVTVLLRAESPEGDTVLKGMSAAVAANTPEAAWARGNLRLVKCADGAGDLAMSNTVRVAAADTTGTRRVSLDEPCTWDARVPCLAAAPVSCIMESAGARVCCLTAQGREKMTHTISPVYHRGVLYGFYQAGELHTVEDVADPSEVMRLSIIPWKGKPSERRYLDVGARSQDFGAFVQTADRPACAQTAIVRGEKVYLFFRGRRAVDQPGLWCYRVYDTATKRLEDGAVICTLDGREFSGLAARDAYNRLSGDTQKRTALGDECNIRLFSDGWYYTAVSTGGDCLGLVVRSKNLTDWESVLTTPDLRAGGTWEYEIFELAPGKWMSAWRQEKLGGVWTAAYDVATRRWSTPERVPDSIAVKPYLFAYRGRNYLATNLKGPVTTPGYGTAVRATLGIFVIDSDGRPELVRKIVNPTGCHYVSSFTDDSGDLYLCHSTDVRRLDATQCRSNIDCFRFTVDFTNKVAAAETVNGSDGASAPPKVIFDTDMLTDFDDVGALACLHAMADAGECEILATVSCTRGNASVAAIEVINAYYGRPEIPVGCSKEIGVIGDRGCTNGVKLTAAEVAGMMRTGIDRSAAGLSEGGHYKYRKLAADYPQWVRHPDSDDAPDANAVYRRALAAAPDGSVVICSVGFLTNLRRLLETKPDDVSPLDGRTLVAKKVKKWVAMACSYPSGCEYNSRMDAESSRIALSEWPTPVVISDFQYGRDVFAGRAVAEMKGPRNPVKDVFAGNIPSREAVAKDSGAMLRNCFGMAGRSAWDETAVLAAVRGENAYFNVERGEYRMVGDRGADEWCPDAEHGRHLRLTERISKAEVGRVIDELICRGPRNRDN